MHGFDAQAVHRDDDLRGDGADQFGLVGGQDGLARVEGLELGPLLLAFLGAAVDLGGHGEVGGVVPGLEHGGVDGGADAEGGGLLLGGGQPGLVVGRGLEQFLGA